MTTESLASIRYLPRRYSMIKRETKIFHKNRGYAEKGRAAYSKPLSSGCIVPSFMRKESICSRVLQFYSACPKVNRIVFDFAPCKESRFAAGVMIKFALRVCGGRGRAIGRSSFILTIG
ncbi:MAG: hypothetical protein ACLSAP_11145 [Oscillospiraceae bacterium]